MFGDRIRGAKVLFLCTPVVWIGGPPILTRPPNKSVRPPNADRLDKAFSAPGFVNNWANGIADAKGLFEADDDAVKVDGLVWLPPVVDDVWLFVSWRFAFWSSTLWDV